MKVYPEVLKLEDLTHCPEDGGVMLGWTGQDFVTWRTDFDGNTFWGHYFGDSAESLQNALKDFADRKDTF